MIVLLDNYDSFTYNLYQVLAVRHAEVRVVRNDQVSLDELIAWAPERIVISPGPGAPEGAGISLEVIRHFSGRVPLLGVCLGHQALAHAFGGTVTRAERLMHGKTSPIEHEGRGVFRDLPRPFAATRYHSLIVQRDNLPADFDVTAWTAAGEIMGLLHRPTGAEGVQFHPESILTEHGEHLLANFLAC
ncbi:MAG: aminodeoxychorismate/anthranilate synthase component II [Myxococcota bacterium]